MPRVTKEHVIETNEHANDTTRALVRPALDGETWAEWMPTIQNAGVDTIEFRFDLEIGQAELEGVFQVKARRLDVPGAPFWRFTL